MLYIQVFPDLVFIIGFWIIVMALDSKAHFSSKVAEYGLQDMMDEFESNGWDTLGNFAAGCDWVPGVSNIAISILRSCRNSRQRSPSWFVLILPMRPAILKL